MQVSDQHSPAAIASGIDDLAGHLFKTLSFYFPVCMASDEFHFFPQATVKNKNWSRWDDFSSESISDISSKLQTYKLKLDHFSSGKLHFDQQVDISLLQRIIRTILEQLTLIKPHVSHPSWYLTIAGIGLAEALDAGAKALNDRLKGLPDFLLIARQNLETVNDIFRNQGCDMIHRLCAWIQFLPAEHNLQTSAIDSLKAFHSHLVNITSPKEFLLAKDLYEQVVFHHMGFFMSAKDIEQVIDNEIHETRSLVQEYTSGLLPECSWEKTIADFNVTLPHRNSVKQAYRSCISQLKNHCIEKQFVARDLAETCPVRVENVPDCLLPVRSNAAYSMPPGHPPSGGTFFIVEPKSQTDRQPALKITAPLDYRLLAAHETYPGHHLLDTSRWGLKNVIRRHMEFPVFYEGWACFSEEILFDTGFFHHSFDRMLSAKRRLWRAIRGKTDLDVHLRRKSPEAAAAFLSEFGMAEAKALELVRKYILKPGYQLSYAVGRCCFKDLYETFTQRGGHTETFVSTVLSQGEIGFNHLSQRLQRGGNA